MGAANELSTAALLAGLTISAGLFFLLLAVLVGFLGLCCYWLLTAFWKPKQLQVTRIAHNPILRPIPEHWWESQAVFNPAAFVDQGRVHLLYRALGNDGISRIGYASSPDGVHFDDRLPHPAYDWGHGFTLPNTRTRYRPLSYNTDLYASGGGWGGCEDPRTVVIDDHIYMTFGVFESWQSMRLAVTSLATSNFRERLFRWAPRITMSPANETHKNWVLFPEKLQGKFALLHAMTPSITIEYVDSLESLQQEPIRSNNHRAGRDGEWDAFVRGAAAPPIKTPLGWLLFYHGMNPAESSVGYKVGAMLLDLADPTRILYRSKYPVLEPEAWYENDWKPGVVYASGAVVFGDDLFLYYGGGDKYIAAAKTNLREFLHTLTQGEHAVLQPVAV